MTKETKATKATKVAPKAAPEVDERLEARHEAVSKLADEVVKGKHGTGRERMLALGTDYVAVQAEVLKRSRSKK